MIEKLVKTVIPNNWTGGKDVRRKTEDLEGNSTGTIKQFRD